MAWDANLGLFAGTASFSSDNPSGTILLRFPVMMSLSSYGPGVATCGIPDNYKTDKGTWNGTYVAVTSTVSHGPYGVLIVWIYY